MLIAAIAQARTWDGDLHAKNLWIWGVPGVGKSLLAWQQSALASTLMKNSDIWWDRYSLVLTGGVIIENYPVAPAGD
jgi:DNA replication protein DnaC